jgi:hypothetical protein
VANSAPTVSASGSPLSGAAPLAVAFATTAADADGDSLTYSWNFGDGSPTSSVQNPSHTFSTAGTYTVILTVSDGKGGIATAALTVTAATGGAGVPAQTDSDGDGFSDQLETALGSNPNNAADQPAGMAAITQTMTLPVSKMTIKLNEAPDSDGFSVSGSVLIGEGLTLAGQKVIVNVGRIAKSFTLDEKGGTPKGNDSFKLKVKKGKDGTPLQVAAFAAVGLKGSFADSLADDGISRAAAKGAQATVPVTVIFNGISFQKAVSLTNSGKQWQMTKKK